MATGVTTANLDQVNLADEVIVNRDGSTGRMAINLLAAQIVNEIPGPRYPTRAELYADLAWPELTQGVVWDDPTAAYNGLYRKSGASGAGSWDHYADLPQSSLTAAQLAALSQDIATETAARVAADATLGADLTAEATARANADTALSDTLTAEIAARTALDADLTAEATARANADTALSDTLTAEIAARTALDADLTAEATARANADTALSDTLTAEIAARTALDADLTAEATARANADTALSTRVDHIAITDIARPGESPEQFSSVLTGEPEARPAISAGAVEVNAALGHRVWRVTGADVDGSIGYVDVAPRRAYVLELGRIYRLRVIFARAVDPVDPEGNGVDLRVQNLSANKAAVSNVRLGDTYSPTVAGGPIMVSTIISRDAADGIDYVPPTTTRHFVPHLRIYGNAQSTDAALFEWIDITDLILVGADLADLRDDMQAADTALSDALTAETQARTDADAALAQDITDEATARADADDAAKLDRRILRAVQQVLAVSNTFQTRNNNLGLVHGVTDNRNRLLMGQRSSGTTYEGPVIREILGDNSHDILNGIADADGRLLHGVRRNGGYVAAGMVHDPLYDNNLDLIGHVVVDADGRVVFGITSGGSMVNDTGAVSQPWEVFILTGQSLANGEQNAAITTTAPYEATLAAKLTGGPVGKQSETVGTSIVALAEEVNETISTGLARRVLAEHPDTRMLMAGQAWGGKTLAEISIGATDGIYEKILTQLGTIASLDRGAVVRAVGMINGEADGLISTADFDLALEDYRRQFASDAADILGQVEIPYLMTCQTSSVAGYRGSAIALRDSFTTPFAQLQAALTNTRIILVGPKYHLTYIDHAHIDALSTRLWGEKWGQVWRHCFMNRLPWLPVHAKAVTVDNDAIVIDLHSPVGMPIEVDTVSVSDPGDLGFNLLDADTVTIGSVTQTGDFQVTVECSANVPTGSRLSYAFHNGTYPTSGSLTGARGCIRDTDPTISIYTGATMPNWLCAFQQTF